MSDEKILIKPQPGPQTQFLKTSADIAVYGGAAGGGKSYALLLDPLYQFSNPKFNGVIFRRSTVQVRNPGGLWDESYQLYRQLGAHPREAILEWEFKSGMMIKFAHLEHEKTVYDWQGSQIAWIGFDELTHFTESQFFYLLSRNRSMSGVPGRVRATCNPDSDSWVRKLIDWWIDEEGYPIKERSGVLRWFVRDNDEIIWSDTRQELIDRYGNDALPKSFTFIPSSVYDNKILMEKDPSYLANLKALSRVERLRLLGGNWNVRPSAGMYFQTEWFEILPAMPSGSVKAVRYWDRAATRPSETNKDPDWSVGLKMHKMESGIFVVEHVVRFQEAPLKVEENVKNIASQDGFSVRIGIEQDPGSAGVSDVQNYARMLSGYEIKINKPTKDKVTRAKAVSAQCEARNVKIVRGAWNDNFFKELENFPDGGHDDQVDTLSGAFNELCSDVSMFDVL